jgi:hypothetical protein
MRIPYPSFLRPFFNSSTSSGLNATLDPERIEKRLRQRPSKAEVAALAIGLSLTFGFALLHAQGVPTGLDYQVFLDAARGDPYGYYYAEWFLPIFNALDLLPFELGYVLWNLLNLAGMWLALRVFNGPRALTLFSYQMLYILYYGNIVGVILGALALAWWALHRNRFLIAGLGFFVAATKFQLGIPLGLALWLLADISWYTRLRSLLVALIGLLASLVIWPGWPLELYDRLLTSPPYAMGNVSLWPILGPVVLLLLLPPLLLKLSTTRRLIAWTAAIALVLPYFQQTDLLGLFVLPVGRLPLLGNIGYLMVLQSWTALQWLVIVPILAYIWALWPQAEANQR